MIPTDHEIWVYRNYLHPLSRLSDFEIADGYTDVCGWNILGNDGVKFGKVHELMVDIQAKKVRYLDVDINKDILKDRDEAYHILIPIGVAILNKDDRNVIVPPLNIENLKDYPFYRREPVYVLRDYERSVRDFYAGKERRDRRYDPLFYEDRYYSEENFS